MKRIQRKRAPGWRKPASAIDCTRPGPWGNPYTVREVLKPVHSFIVVDKLGVVRCHAFLNRNDAARIAVGLFKHDLRIKLLCWPEYLEPLRGKDLLCWCREDDPCHADVLLELANQGVWVTDHYAFEGDEEVLAL